jgi:hypothetical protein
MNPNYDDKPVNVKRNHKVLIDDDESVSNLSVDSTELQKKGRWSPSEDNLLRKYVSSFGDKNWQKISDKIEGRSPLQCLHRWSKILKPGLIKGPWTKEEDSLLTEWVEAQGPNKWAQAAAVIKGRSGKQIRERWFNHLDPRLKHSKWTSSEDEQIFDLYQKYGSSWSKIAKGMQGRPENSIKNRFYSTLRRIASDRRKANIIASRSSRKKRTSPKKDDLSDGLLEEERSTLYRLLEDKVVLLGDDISESELKEASDSTDFHQMIKIDGDVYLISRDVNEAAKYKDSEIDNLKLLEEIDQSIKEKMVSSKFDKIVEIPEDFEKRHDDFFDFSKEDLSHLNGQVKLLNDEKLMTPKQVPAEKLNISVENIDQILGKIDRGFSEHHHNHHDRFSGEQIFQSPFCSPMACENKIFSYYQNLENIETILSTTKNDVYKYGNRIQHENHSYEPNHQYYEDYISMSNKKRKIV